MVFLLFWVLVVPAFLPDVGAATYLASIPVPEVFTPLRPMRFDYLGPLIDSDREKL
jgi:hypothetical protein